MSFTGQNRRAWANYGSSYTNQDLLPEDLYYGNLPKVSAAGQLGKRMRSNSDEDSILRMSQVQAWLKDQATVEDFEKIWRIFLDSTASSSTHAYGGTDPSYQGNPHLKAIDPMANDPAQSSISADSVFTPGLGLSGAFGQNQNCIDPTSFTMDYDMNSSAGQTSTLSMVSPSEPFYSDPPSRPRAPLRSEPSDNNAVARATLMLRPSSVRSKQDRTRDSVQSTSSYSPMNSDMSTKWSSKCSSTSSFGGQSVSSFRKPSQKPMHLSVKKPHSRSSSISRASNSIPSSDIPCTDPDCSKTFTRDPDRKRHESSFHKNKVGYTCLLHTCAASCPEPCTDKIHKSSYYNARPDKMKEHLEKVHGWRLKQSEIPEEFRHSYEWQQRGWVCSYCWEDIGSWHDDRDKIAAHHRICRQGCRLCSRE